MQRQCLHVIIAENHNAFSLCSRNIFAIVCRHHHWRCAGSICTRWFSIDNRYGAVWRNIQEPGFETVLHSRAKPRCPVLFWYFVVPVAVIQGSYVDALLPQLWLLLPARPSRPGAYLTHHQVCLPRSLLTSHYNLPLLESMSRRPAHCPVD